MKITVNLTEAEAKGIKAYLLELGEKNDKKAIQEFINGIVQTTLQSSHEAVSDYIKY